MFGPWIEIYSWLRTLLPSWHFKDGSRFRRPSFNFITLHYMYLIVMTLIGSVILYGSKNMRYIDALFFASGAATQSGLNTIDVNTIHLYQQITLMLIASVCNPIFINTFVVFIRLYWFEKRFQNVVIEAQRLRRTRTRDRSRSRTRTEIKAEHDPDLEERGVGHHRLLVVRPGEDTIDDAEKAAGQHARSASRTDSSSSGAEKDKDEKFAEQQAQSPAITRREITFADEMASPTAQDDEIERMPVRRAAEHHIAFVERQRNTDKDEVLFIPGPRDFDKGYTPQQVRPQSDIDGLQRTRSSDMFPPLQGTSSRQPGDTRGETAQERPTTGHLFSRALDGVVGAVRLDKLKSRSTAVEDPDQQNLRGRGRSRTFASFMTTHSDEADPMPYLSYAPTVYRNSAFVNLSESQREELGGIEYRALKTLAATLCIYYVGFHIFGLLSFLPWISYAGQYYQNVLSGDGVSKYWWGVFTPASCFNDLGFTVTPDSMVSFQRAVWPLLCGSFLIIIGNTGFPCMLRFCIWIMAKVTRHGSPLWEEFRFLLDHPRRCFTLLFPSKATWWLFWILVVLNGCDLILFIILDLNDEVVTSLPPGLRVLNGWFQAASTRTAGFAVVNLAALHPAIQVSYLVMMYISIFPIAISVRRTNVYEEKSLGVYASNEEADDSGTHSYVGTHLRRQLSFDLWYVFLGLFIIAIVEGGRLQNTNEYAFTLFSVLFEIVSAYGTVGLSLGYPGINASFSAEFTTLSKLVIIAMQIRGRHRGLPYALDKAVLLPSENLHQKEAEEANRRAQRRGSEVSHGFGQDDGADSSQPAAQDGSSPLDARNPTANPSRRGTFASDTTRKTQRTGSGLARLLSNAFSAGPAAKHRYD